MYTNPVHIYIYTHLIILWLEGTTGEGKYVLSSRLDVWRREGVNFVFLACNSNEGNKRWEKMKMSYISFSIERIFSNVIPLKVGRRKFWKIILSALIKWYKVWTSLFEEFSKSLIKRRSKAIYFRFAFHPRRFRSIILKLSKYGKSSLLDSSEKGAKFYICFFNNFHNLGQKSQRKNSMRFLLKRRILRREILLSLLGWKKIVPIVRPCIMQHHARLEILKFTATDARVARTSSKVPPLHSSRFFLSFLRFSFWPFGTATGLREDR